MKSPTGIRHRLNLRRQDIGIMLGIGTLAVILNVYPFPAIAALTAIIAILLMRLNETAESPPEQDSALIGAHDVQELTVRYGSTDEMEQHKAEMARAGYFTLDDDLLPPFMLTSLRITYRRQESRKGV